MRRNTRQILSLMLAAFISVAVSLTSALQFHHHDCDGRAYFTLDGSNDLVLEGGDYGFIQDCQSHCHHEGGHRSASHGHGEECGLHFTDFYGNGHDPIFWWAAVLTSGRVVVEPAHVFVTVFLYDYKASRKIPDEYCRISRRGPPLAV